ncbi:MAG: S1 RNA-binding domain-containing protein [Anaerolineales bacterium]|nr:S1 RNA-binding domain-containing protein [Anaerolineales bacterium]
MELEKKMKIKGKVVKLALAGAVVKIEGSDLPGVLHISLIREEPVKRVEDVLEVGQEIEAWVRRVDTRTGRVELTMIEPLKMEWREIKKGSVLKGTVTRIEKFGAFIDIGAERPGLAHISELTHEYIRSVEDVFSVGSEVDVMVVDFNRRRKQIKLSLKALLPEPEPEPKKLADVEMDEENDEPAPTAMEIALKKAMDKNLKDGNSSKKKSKKMDDYQEDILSRTLENRTK